VWAGRRCLDRLWPQRPWTCRLRETMRSVP
jgi:hypothetical protein